MKIPSFLQQQRQKYLLWAFGTIFLVGAILVWYGYFREAPTPFFEQTASPLPRAGSVDVTIFDDPIFEELGSPVTEFPIPDPDQRVNPFVPN